MSYEEGGIGREDKKSVGRSVVVGPRWASKTSKGKGSYGMSYGAHDTANLNVMFQENGVKGKTKWGDTLDI